MGDGQWQWNTTLIKSAMAPVPLPWPSPLKMIAIYNKSSGVIWTIVATVKREVLSSSHLYQFMLCRTITGHAITVDKIIQQECLTACDTRTQLRSSHLPQLSACPPTWIRPHPSYGRSRMSCTKPRFSTDKNPDVILTNSMRPEKYN